MLAELYRDGNSKALLLFKRGRKMLHCLMIAPPVRIVRLEMVEERRLTPLLRKGTPYSVKRAVRKFRAAGRTLGITDKARQVLRELGETE